MGEPSYFLQSDTIAFEDVQVPAVDPFTGVALALEAGVPEHVCHLIAAHAGEGDMVKRTTEAYVVHHADFMTFLPFKNR